MSPSHRSLPWESSSSFRRLPRANCRSAWLMNSVFVRPSAYVIAEDRASSSMLSVVRMICILVHTIQRNLSASCRGRIAGIANAARRAVSPFLATCLMLALTAERPVEVESRADEGQVGEGLREVAKRFSAMSRFFGIKTEMVGVPQHLFKDEPGLIKPRGIGSPGPGQRLDEPKRAEIESPFIAVEAVRGFRGVVAVHEAVGDQPPLGRRAVNGIEGLQHARVAR